MPNLIPLIDRINLDQATGCWNWRGGHVPAGYGKGRFMGREMYAHRISAILWLGMDPQSTLKVLHRCDNPACFNPKHLFIGTQADNLLDCVAKGRHSLASRTHCVNGHLFIDGNYSDERSSSGRKFRRCNVCRKEKYNALMADPENRKEYREYQKRYMREYRAR